MYSKWRYFRTHHKLLISLIILSGVILFWRGFWGLLETYLYPENPQLSYFLCLVLGVVILGITHYSIEGV